LMQGDGRPLTPVSGPLLPPRKDLFAGLSESWAAAVGLTLLALEGDTAQMSAARILRNAWWWRTA
jgi:hypothetical protein